MRSQKMFRQGVLWLGGLVLAAALVFLLPLPSKAVTKDWVGGTSWWSIAGNWDPSGQPGDDDDVNLIQSDATDRTVYYWNTLYPDAVLNSLRIDATGTGTMTFDMSTGHSLFAQEVDVGRDGTGTFSHNDGTAEFDIYRIGRFSGSNGIYELSDDAILRVNGNGYIGLGGTGTFTQTGGSHFYDTLSFGRNPGSSGSYNLSNGTLSGNLALIAGNGDGSFIQTGGSHTIEERLVIGRIIFASGGNGTYELRGGTLEAEGEAISGPATASFTQTGGSNTIFDDLLIAFYSEENGTYDLSGGGLEAAIEYVGYGGTGRFSQTGGFNIIRDHLYLGFEAGSRGRYELGGDGILQARTEVIGDQGRGDFIQEDGGNMTQNLVLGREVGGVGTYALSGGILRPIREGIGLNGSGTFTQTGGDHWVREALALAVNRGSSGEYLLRDGTLRSGSLEVGLRGTFTQTGGTFATGPLTNAGEVNLEGGRVNVTGDIINRRTGELNIAVEASFPGDATNNGTIKTTGATVTWGGTFTNNGAYISDPSKQTFGNLVVGQEGYLVGYSQDLFVVTGNLEIQSTQNDKWQTDQATLQFLNAVNNPNPQQINETEQISIHAFYIPGADLGPGGGAHNFRWGTLVVDGVTVHILDGNPQNQGSALYVGQLQGLEIDENTQTIMNIYGFEGLHLYYDPYLNPDLHGMTYSLMGLNNQIGGQLVPTPVPASVLLLGSGLLGLGLLGRRKKRG